MAANFDPKKDAANVAKHGISLARAADFDELSVVRDGRRDYGEDRFLGFGRIDGEPDCLVFTLRNGEIRPISLRRAHDKEFERHVPSRRSDRS